MTQLLHNLLITLDNLQHTMLLKRTQVAIMSLKVALEDMCGCDQNSGRSGAHCLTRLCFFGAEGPVCSQRTGMAPPAGQGGFMTDRFQEKKNEYGGIEYWWAL
jgi:hypothetical protein